MKRLGLQTNESGTAILIEHFNKTVNTRGNVINNYKKILSVLKLENLS